MTKIGLSINKAEAKKAVEKALTQSPVDEDLNFEGLKKARIGDPVIVKDTEGTDTFIIAPLIMGQKASGYARLDLNLNVSQVSIFGANPQDSQSWVNASFFYSPPTKVIKSIKEKYPEMKMSKPIFSFSKSYAKWGWIVELSNKHQISILIAPSGWSEIGKSKADTHG